MVCDLDGTIKVFKDYPHRTDKGWKGKSFQTIGEKHKAGLNVTWESAPIRVVEQHAYQVCDFNFA